MPTAIKIENVSKQYRLGVISTGTLSHDLNRWWTTRVLRREDPYLKIGSVNDRSAKADSEYVWALKDINMEIEQGDVVGIIGKNGAGKSTLLKLLSRVTKPTTGTIKYRGRIASLLEVGTGFHPEMTGRENIYMNGAIMGMTRAEITRKMDEIVDFSGCERYIDTPVKRYSSGMTVRLGFAVAAHLDPEILVVDEVLAVGDAEFQKKAIGKMQDVSKGEGRTVLFVSHNMASIRALCKHGVLLENGCVVQKGYINDVVDFYMKNITDVERGAKTIITPEMRDYNRSLKVSFISLEHLKGNNNYASDEDIVLKIVVKAEKSVDDCRINCTIRTLDGQALCNNSSETYFNIKEETKVLKYTLINPGLAVGKYTLSFSVGIGNMTIGESNFDVITNALTIEIDKPHKDADSYFVKWDNFSWGHILLQNKLEEIAQ